MNKTLSTTLIVIAVLVLAGGLFFAGSMYARFNAFVPMMSFGYNRNNSNSYGPVMSGARGSYGMGPGMTLAPGASAGVGYGWNNGVASNAVPLTVDQARQAAAKYIQSLNVQGLEIAEVMLFDNNAYVAVRETATGLGAFELLVDPASQVAFPEYGPNMMWNLKYGGMSHGGMMGNIGVYGMMNRGYSQSTSPANVSADMPVTKADAIKDAQAYLDQAQPGTIAADDPMQFYGYYTLDFSKDGKVAGMLSVNGFSGQIFLHTWHGTFIEESR